MRPFWFLSAVNSLDPVPDPPTLPQLKEEEDWWCQQLLNGEGYKNVAVTAVGRGGTQDWCYCRY